MAKWQAPSGFRDYPPEVFRRRRDAAEKIRRVYESFGYEGLETPAVENLAVLLGKAGGENEKLMFRVLKRGAELQRALEKKDELADLALRFDLTVPLARFYATHRPVLPALFKRYQIGPVWRAERPQHGRFREFIQCDVDLLGSASPLAEADVILATATALAALGFSALQVRLNSRPLLGEVVRSCGVPDELAGRFFVAVDKLEKLEPAEARGALIEAGAPPAAADRLLDFRASLSALDSAARLDAASAWTGGRCAAPLERLREIRELLPALPSGALVFDPFLARGLDYYTGPIFEIAAAGIPFALAGGGRYDELIGALSGQPVPAVGFSIGFERILTVLEERGQGDAPPPNGALVAVPGPEARGEALRLAAELRAAGLTADLFAGDGKLNQQFELAEKKGLRWAVIPEPRELEQGRVAVRDLAARRNTPVPRAALADWLRSQAGLARE